MKNLCLLLLFMFSTLTISAQDRLSDYVRQANRYARVDLPRYRQRLSKEYKISRRDLDRCFNLLEKNWGYVGLVLEISRISGKDIDDVYGYYKHIGHRGWKHVLNKIGIEPGSEWYDPFFERIHENECYWNDCYEDYQRDSRHRYKHHRHHHSSCDDDCYDRYYDEDDCYKRDYDDDDDDDDGYYKRDDDDDDDDDDGYYKRDDDDDDGYYKRDDDDDDDDDGYYKRDDDDDDDDDDGYYKRDDDDDDDD